MTLSSLTFRKLQMVVALSALVIAGLAAARPASAGCSDGAPPAKQHSSAHLSAAVYRPDGPIAAGLIQLGDEWFERSSIVGLWEFEVHLNGAQNGLPDNFLFDWGLATWHDDGTEIQFSAGRPPSAGDVCMGVWRQVGWHKFKLHHVALGLTPPTASGTFVGPAIIRADVTVDPSEDQYMGPYTLTMYPGSPDNGTEFNENGTPLVVFNATMTAKRVTP